MISVLVLTKNEEQDLPGCLRSVAWSDDIVVYDSFSNDRTHEIARASGARVIQRPDQDPSVAFGGDEAYHRTWGLREISYRYAWLFVIDADERLTPEAARELEAIASAPTTDAVAYRIRRRDFFQGRHLKHVQSSPWFIRFFRPELVRYDRLVNPITLVDGPVADLIYPLDHYPFSKGLSQWISRHNTYSSLESQQILRMRIHKFKPSVRRAIFSSDQAEKRLHLKFIYYFMPFRPLLKFVIIYFLRRGFLDGGPGLRYALMVLMYEFMIDLKLKEDAR